MRQFFLLTVLLALVAPVAAGSMETLNGGIAKTALDILSSAALPPSIALLCAAICGALMLESSRA